MLADLSAEHYSWVATGDLANPDATTVMERGASFYNRLDVLFLQGHIFKLHDSYTGVALEFLKRTHFYHYGIKTTVFSIGEFKEPETRERIRKALQHVQVVVRNITEMLKVYKLED